MNTVSIDWKTKAKGITHFGPLGTKFNRNFPMEVISLLICLEKIKNFQIASGPLLVSTTAGDQLPDI
jgi:hypothetical protein